MKKAKLIHIHKPFFHQIGIYEGVRDWKITKISMDIFPMAMLFDCFIVPITVGLSQVRYAIDPRGLDQYIFYDSKKHQPRSMLSS